MEEPIELELLGCVVMLDDALEISVLDDPLDGPVFVEAVFDDALEPALDEVLDDDSLDVPALDERVLDEPVSDEPMLDEPVLDEPVLDEPVLDEPVFDEPVWDEPVSDEPVSDEPVFDEPVFDEPVFDEPVSDEPVLDEPVFDEPVLDEPVLDEPVSDEPVLDEPVIDEPVLDEVEPLPESSGTQNVPGSQTACVQSGPVPHCKPRPQAIAGPQSGVPCAAAHSRREPQIPTADPVMALPCGATQQTSGAAHSPARVHTAPSRLPPSGFPCDLTSLAVVASFIVASFVVASLDAIGASTPPSPAATSVKLVEPQAMIVAPTSSPAPREWIPKRSLMGSPSSQR
jgi:hypothetical protein